MPKQISCPSCGGPLQIESAFTPLVVCGYCGQSLYIHDTGVDLAGKTAKLAEYPSRLSVGAQTDLAPSALRPDVFTCGPNAQPQAALDVFVKALRPERTVVNCYVRGATSKGS
jgi:hypothetical protein